MWGDRTHSLRQFLFGATAPPLLDTAVPKWVRRGNPLRHGTLLSWRGVTALRKHGGMELTGGEREVVTETSTYIIDVEAMTATRLAGGAGSLDGEDVPRFALRRDETTVPLLAVPAPVVGQPCDLLLDLRGDGIRTLRRTSWVCHVTQLR